MSDETAQNQQTNEKNSCGTGCPLAMIAQPTWKSLLKPPFHHRHPLIFWTFLLFVFSACLAIFSGNDEDSESILASDSLALIKVSGPITDIGPTLAWISKLEDDEQVKGVLLRVDSPGGGASASQELHSALSRLAGKKPLAVSMGATAASGGLMISMAGKRVFANPSTVTGSIGVRMDIPQLQGLMDKLGLGQQTLVTAPYKDAGSMTRPLTAEEKSYFESVLRDMHEQFVDIVATGRKMQRDKAASLASGRIFTGREALGLGLVDQLGGQDEAHQWLAAQTGVPASRKLLKMPKPKSKWRENLDVLLELGLGLARLSDLANLSGQDTPSRLEQPAFLYRF